MNRVNLRRWVPTRLLPIMALWTVAQVHAGFSTTVPVSEQSASGIVVSSFPVALALEQVNLLLTEPQIAFLSPTRIGVRFRFQAYDHRPDEGVALSETGMAAVSGRVAYDRAARQVLLHDARLEQLNFDRDTAAAQQFARQLHAGWSSKVSNPIRSDLPPHPYLQPFKENIDDILYDGSHITFVISY